MYAIICPYDPASVVTSGMWGCRKSLLINSQPVRLFVWSDGLSRALSRTQHVRMFLYSDFRAKKCIYLLCGCHILLNPVTFFPFFTKILSHALVQENVFLC